MQSGAQKRRLTKIAISFQTWGALPPRPLRFFLTGHFSKLVKRVTDALGFRGVTERAGVMFLVGGNFVQGLSRVVKSESPSRVFYGGVGVVFVFGGSVLG